MDSKVQQVTRKTAKNWMTDQKLAVENSTYANFLKDIDIGLALGRLPFGPVCQNWLADLEQALKNSFNAPSERRRLSFLAHTGKVELPVRDEVLWQLSKGLSPVAGTTSIWYGREHHAVDGVKGPGSAGSHACAAFQAKQIYVADLYCGKGYCQPRKVPHDLLLHLNLDIRLKAPCNLNVLSNDVRVGLLLVADFPASATTCSANVAYPGLVAAQQKNRWVPAAWKPHLDQQLSTLDLHVAQPNGRRLEGRWPTHVSEGSDVSIHWFLVVPI